MCHISRHIWICHRRNNSAVGDISARGEIQVISSVFVCISVCECARQPPHTLAVEWKKSSAALFFHFPAQCCSLCLSFSSPHFDSKPCCALSNSVAMVTVKLWFLLVALWSCHLSCQRWIWLTCGVFFFCCSGSAGDELCWWASPLRAAPIQQTKQIYTQQTPESSRLQL